MAKGAMKPHLPHTAFTALPYQLYRYTRVCCNYDAVDRGRNRAKIGVASCGLNLGCFRVDREHLEPAISQLTINAVSCLPRLSRYTCYCETLAAKKFSDWVGHSGHNLANRHFVIALRH